MAGGRNEFSVRTMTKTRVLAWTAVAGGATGLASFAALHLFMAGQVSPLRDPVSGYALAAPGSVLFPLGAFGFAVACAALAMNRARPPWPGVVRSGVVRPLLGAASVMFVLVVLFPTDSGVAVSSFGGQVHRYAAGAAFVLMTVVGYAGALRPGDARTRRWLVVLTAISAATLLVTTLNTFLPELADGGQWRGMPQRVLLVVQALMIFVMAAATARRRGEGVRVSRSQRVHVVDLPAAVAEHHRHRHPGLVDP